MKFSNRNQSTYFYSIEFEEVFDPQSHLQMFYLSMVTHALSEIKMKVSKLF